MPERTSLSGGALFNCIVIFLIAFAVRAGYLVTCADGGRHEGPLRVQDTPPSAAPVANIEDGQLRFVSQNETLYTWSLGLLAKVWTNPARLNQVALWGQCVLGALTAVCYFLMARLVAGGGAALLTGLFCALSPFWILSAGEMDDGVLAAFLLGVCLFLGTRGGLRGGGISSLLFGMGLAALALVRIGLLPFAWVGLLWYLFRARRVTLGWAWALIAVVGVLAVAVPWGYHNYRQSGEVFPALRGVYADLWQGNNPEASGGPWRRSETPMKPDRDLAEEVGQEAAHNPGATLERRLWAGLCFFFGEDFLRQQRLWAENVGDDKAPQTPGWFRAAYPAALYGWLLGMLILAVLGWRWSYEWRFAGRPLTLALLWIPLPYLLGHAAALQGPRLPLDGVLITFAALAFTGRHPAAPPAPLKVVSTYR